MSETILLVAGCVIFATTTVATLLYGYMVVNRAWEAENPVKAAVPALMPDQL
jgi:hypothetical protein